MSESIFRVSSSIEGNQNFGTAFCVFQDEISSYLVTCKHVVDSVGGSESTLISGQLIDEAYFNIASEADIAVIKVSNLKAYTLPSGVDCLNNTKFCTFGWYLYNDNPVIYKNEGLSGGIKKSINLQYSNKNISVKGWDLEVEEGDLLKKGFSGSPVIDKKTRLVFAVVSHLEKNGKTGTAISVQEMLQACTDLPKDIIRKDLFDLERMRRNIRNEFQEKNGRIKNEFYTLLSDFGFEASDEAFLIAVEVLVNHCHLANECEKLESKITVIDSENKKPSRFFSNFFFKKEKKADYSYCTCRIHYKTNLPINKASIPVQALASELGLCYEDLNIVDAKEGSIIVDFLVKRKYLKKIISLYDARELVISNLGIEYVQEIIDEDFDYFKIENLLYSVMSFREIRDTIYDKYPNSISSLPDGYSKRDIVKNIIDEAKIDNSMSSLLNYIQTKKKKLYAKYKPYYRVPLRPKGSHVTPKIISKQQLLLIFLVATGIAAIGAFILVLAQFSISKLIGGIPGGDYLASMVWFALVPLGIRVGGYVSESFNRNREQKVAAFASACYMMGYHIGTSIATSVVVATVNEKVDFIATVVSLLIGMNLIDSLFTLINLVIGTFYAYQRVRQG